jgi:hypothetical protein
MEVSSSKHNVTNHGSHGLGERLLTADFDGGEIVRLMVDRHRKSLKNLPD